MKLTKSEIKALLQLWEAGIHNAVAPSSNERRFFQSLRQKGYAITFSVNRNFRITENGILRIEDPAKLFVKEVMES